MRLHQFLYSVVFLYLISLSSVAFGNNPLDQCNNQGFLKAQREFENSINQYKKEDVPVHICGTVIAYSKQRRTRSGEHGYFYVNVGSGITIRVVSNLDVMHTPVWPWVKKGDYAEVVGRYYYDNPRRQGIDWTHKGTSRKWPYPGYVLINGIKYD